MEHVTAYSFGVAAKWQADGFISGTRFSISYDLNQDSATKVCIGGENINLLLNMVCEGLCGL